MTTTEKAPTTAPQVSTGAGIAIAGAWIAGSAVTISLCLIQFVLTKPDPNVKIDGWTAALTLFFLAAPMLAAYSITKKILGIKD